MIIAANKYHKLALTNNEWEICEQARSKTENVSCRNIVMQSFLRGTGIKKEWSVTYKTIENGKVNSRYKAILKIFWYEA